MSNPKKIVQMSNDELEKIVNDYLDYFNVSTGKQGNQARRDLAKDLHPLSMAYDTVDNIIKKQPLDVTIKLIDLLIQKAETQEQLAYIAAGPLEDLIWQSDQAFERILETARKNPKWKETLSFVWESDNLGKKKLKQFHDFLGRSLS